ncbi:MAG TPA: cryptochrome/photolyase family protein [Thermosynechococcus sp. M3746_W2019_013]|uniref:cryptochrome/photolyase family protein n=1 Tax=Thermosynechococcus sp. M3746_W2019_013 TaxID=2747806 RepID=UPI001A10A19A|nr:cryptochrome/photolyase family protein [Thermosynechococcus sp. M3746_W2019_013]HIK23799.1 cryptochrome/photolyase family protein [Thermosynechococcus sp. M3746_W2019_013]
MAIGVWVLGDQLSLQQAALQSCAHPVPVILIESHQWVKQRRYHAQKLVLVWSAMRHFAQDLEAAGWPVTYAIAPDFATPLRQWISAHNIHEVRIMQPSDRPFRDCIATFDLPCAIKLLPNNHFLWSEADFQQWAAGRKTLVLEHFYRAGRQRFQILMEGKSPAGGKWNYDAENRQGPAANLKPPPPLRFCPDRITQEVIETVRQGNFDTYGHIEPFYWGVSRAQALQVLENFIEYRLPQFGPYQDAMVVGEETLWHSLLSPYLNLGLLSPQEVIDAALVAYGERQLPLNSVEGFIRQILGWREYMYGLYHYLGADYCQRNFFQHHQSLPAFFWQSDRATMSCLRYVLKQIECTGYAHHIQRLMILANFALITGLAPQEVENWFHSVFIDAYDWVMQTNVLGMGLFADGGLLASKPYAASANYIQRMSNYCQGCAYNPKQRVGDRACPFNFFYWHFLARHRTVLSRQGRMAIALKNLEKLSALEMAAIQQEVERWYFENS